MKRKLMLMLAVMAGSLTPGASLGQTAPPRQQQPAQGQPAPRQTPVPAQSRLPVQNRTPVQNTPARPGATPTPAPRNLAPARPGAAVASPKPAASGKPDRVRIYSDKAIYRRQEKKAEAIGHVKIVQDNTTIFADKVLYNEANKQSTVDSGVKIVQVNKTKDKGRTTTITAGKMTAFHEERRMLLREEVRMDRDPVAVPEPAEYAQSKAEKRARTERALEKARTVITSDQMEYFTRTEDANLDGKVVVLQKDKKLTGDKAVIKGEQNGDLIIVEGKAQVTQIRGNWLIQNKIIKPDPEDEEQQRLLHEKMVMDADKITMFRATDDLKAEGNVKITQKVGGKERVAVGKEGTYSEKQQLATLTGNVRIQREDGSWMTADKVLYHTDKEVFEAFGTPDKQVEFEGYLYDDEHPEPKEPINAPLPEFDLDQHQPGQRLPAWLRDRQTPQRAPAQPTQPASPAPTARPTSQPTPAPTPRPSATPSAGASPRPGSPSPRSSPVTGTFNIPTN